MISEQTRNSWKDKLDTIYQAYEFATIELNDWEVNFMDSIDKTLNDGKDLSMKQSQCLTKIYERC